MTIEAGIELSPQSRFSVHDNPDVAPGKCAVCASVGGDGRKFIDFGMQLDWYGAVYFCTFCVAELAGAGGFVATEHFNKAVEQNGLLTKELNATNESFRNYRDATRTMLRGCVCYDGKLPGDSEVRTESVPKPRTGKSGTASDNRKSD